jgi:hypothetical protein
MVVDAQMHACERDACRRPDRAATTTAATASLCFFGRGKRVRGKSLRGARGGEALAKSVKFMMPLFLRDEMPAVGRTPRENECETKK